LLPPIGKKKKRSKRQREAAEEKPPQPAQAKRERERGAAGLRATPEHRGLYDVLEENLVAGNQELEGDMDFFTTSKRKARTFGEWIAGVLGLLNVVDPDPRSQEDG
jgi:hypothetical protein